MFCSDIATGFNLSVVGTMSGDDLSSEYQQEFGTLRQPLHMIIIYTFAYSLVFILGLSGNVLVVTVVYRTSHMHTLTNYFIVNLAVADILVCLFCLPITLLSNLYYGECY